MTTPLFAPDTNAGRILADWWQKLADTPGDRAELRRAKTPQQAILVPATIHLIEALKSTEVASHASWIDRIAAIAGLAAHLSRDARALVLSDKQQSLAKSMAAKKGDGCLVSQLRFRRLLKTSRAELYRPMVRILAMLDHKASLYSLAESIFWWGPNVQKQWALEYFPACHK